MEMYDPRFNAWSAYMRMGARRLQFGVAVMQNKLIVVGGRDCLKTLNTVSYYSLLKPKEAPIFVRINALTTFSCFGGYKRLFTFLKK